eukprot:scaffold91_cov127-Cylindrotheca_fusiformis.AAC.33
MTSTLYFPQHRFLNAEEDMSTSTDYICIILHQDLLFWVHGSRVAMSDEQIEVRTVVKRNVYGKNSSENRGPDPKFMERKRSEVLQLVRSELCIPRTRSLHEGKEVESVREAFSHGWQKKHV